MNARKAVLILAGFIFTCMISGCRHLPTGGVSDLLPVVQLQSGTPLIMPVQDLFYADDYDLRFGAHPSIRAAYDGGDQTVRLVADDRFEGLSLVPFAFRGREYQLPVRSQIIDKHTFIYKPEKSPRSLNLFGSFNSWNRNSMPMTDSDGDGIYEYTVILDPGRYEYRFKLDDTEIVDPNNPQKVPNPFGEFNSLLEIPSRHQDSVFLHHLGARFDEESIEIVFFYERQNKNNPISHQNVIALDNNVRIPEDRIKIEGGNIRLSLEKSGLGGKHVIRVAVTQDGMSTFFQTIPIGDGRYIPDIPGAFTWHDAILYSIIVDRFYDGDPVNTRPVSHAELSPKANYHGGDIQGILDKLHEGYFDRLGVNTLWLSPILQNPLGAFKEFTPPRRYFTGYHGYWPIHPTVIDTRFGNMRLFKSLVDHCHNRGVNILLDFVANHVHQEHPFYKEHPEWFGRLELPDGRKNIRFWDEYRLTTWFDTFLPSFDYLGSDEAVEAMTDNAAWWLETTRIDGFRQDAVKHIPNRFWRLLTHKIKGIGLHQDKEIFQIGETFGGYDLIKSYVNNGQLNSQFNFHVYDIGIPTFLDPDADFAVLDAEMQKVFEVYGMNHLMGNLMDSHDKVRYMAYADGDLEFNSPLAQEMGWDDPPSVDDPGSYDKAKLYLAFILTIPGIPVVYYGDEIGMSGASDPDNRRPMRFGDELTRDEVTMFGDVSRLIHARREHSSLRFGDFYTLLSDRHIYAYIRSDIKERILVVLNKSTASRRAELFFPPFYAISESIDILDKDVIPVRDNGLTLDLPPMSAKIMVLQK